MKTKTFTAYNDPSHGWVKVPRALLEKLGIADMISSYSYQRGEDVFLEEDSDATLFMQAYIGEYGVMPNFVDKYTNKSSKIRSYESYRYMTPELKNELANLKVRMLNFRHWDSRNVNRIKNAGLETMQFWAAAYGF